MSEREAEKAYTWSEATRDLALGTPLTLREAGDVTWELRDTSLAPYDALPLLVRLFSETTAASRGAALAGLLTSPGKPS